MAAIELNPKIDQFLLEGCMRCKFGGTPQCKVHSWQNELKALRKLVLECGLTEEHKWGMPCYTFNNKNVLIVSPYKEAATLSFFKGSLMDDPFKLLVKPGESSQAARFIKYTDVKQILSQWDVLKDYVFQAIELERLGKKVEFKKNLEPMPEELMSAFKQNPKLKSAFEALTTGRQRGYILFFSQPKNSETRTKRILKATPDIMKGIGMNGR